LQLQYSSELLLEALLENILYRWTMTRLIFLLLRVGLFIYSAHRAGASCPNQCSGHGECTTENVCRCDSGWTYHADCSSRAASGAKPCAIVDLAAQVFVQMPRLGSTRPARLEGHIVIWNVAMSVFAIAMTHNLCTWGNFVSY